MSTVTFGQRIRELRRERRLTQRQLAERVESLNRNLRCDFTYLSKIENDRLDTLPSEELIRGLAQVLEVHPDELLDLAGKFDQRLLQNVVTEMPEVGILLRRLQAGKIPRTQIRKILGDSDKE